MIAVFLLPFNNLGHEVTEASANGNPTNLSGLLRELN
jgi:hypothetical protein